MQHSPNIVKCNLIMNKWAIGLAVVVFGLVTFIYLGSRGQSLGLSSAQEVDMKISDQDWMKGNSGAQVSLVEYSDFQCPACAAYYPFVRRLEEELGEKLKVVYRQFPLISAHPNAYPAARASEAAGNQGKFWEMHDILFERQEEWSAQVDAKENFVTYAKEIGLDEAQFLADYDSDIVKDRVNEDISSGNDFEVNATPTFFLNGRKMAAPANYEGFKSLVNGEFSN